MDGGDWLHATSKRPSSKLPTTFHGHTESLVLILLGGVLWKLFPLVFPSGFPDHIGTTLWPVRPPISTRHTEPLFPRWHNTKPPSEVPDHLGPGGWLRGVQAFPVAPAEPLHAGVSCHFQNILFPLPHSCFLLLSLKWVLIQCYTGLPPA